jgi:hypothetical protein
VRGEALVRRQTQLKVKMTAKESVAMENERERD